MYQASTSDVIFKCHFTGGTSGGKIASLFPSAHSFYLSKDHAIAFTIPLCPRAHIKLLDHLKSFSEYLPDVCPRSASVPYSLHSQMCQMYLAV